MRDSKRIKRILRLVRKIWLKNPDLRLMQLLGNCFNARDNYFKKDNELETRLKEIYLNSKSYTPEALEKISKEFKKILRKIYNV